MAWRLPHWQPVWGSFWVGRLLKKLNGKRQKKADFVRFATAALSSQSVPANYNEMRLLGLHIACQYGVHINKDFIILSLVCCCCYDLKFTLVEYFKPTIEDIFVLFYFCFVLFCFVLFFLRKKIGVGYIQALLAFFNSIQFNSIYFIFHH